MPPTPQETGADIGGEDGGGGEAGGRGRSRGGAQVRTIIDRASFTKIQFRNKLLFNV